MDPPGWQKIKQSHKELLKSYNTPFFYQLLLLPFNKYIAQFHFIMFFFPFFPFSRFYIICQENVFEKLWRTLGVPTQSNISHFFHIFFFATALGTPRKFSGTLQGSGVKQKKCTEKKGFFSPFFYSGNFQYEHPFPFHSSHLPGFFFSPKTRDTIESNWCLLEAIKKKHTHSFPPTTSTSTH